MISTVCADRRTDTNSHNILCVFLQERTIVQAGYDAVSVRQRAEFMYPAGVNETYYGAGSSYHLIKYSCGT